MRKYSIFTVFLLITLLAGCDNSNNANQSPEEFAKLVLNTFVKNDKESFIQFSHPTEKELLNFINKNILAEKQKDAKHEIKENYNKKFSNILSSWDVVYEKSTIEGFKWKDTSYKGAKYQIKKTRYGISKADIYVILGVENKEYIFKLDDCVLINGRWVLFDTMKWKGENT